MGDHRSSRKTRPKRKGLYSEGEKNKLIDALLDPLAKEDDIFIVIDSVLHFLNEKDTEASLVKFAKYTLPKLLRRDRKSTRMNSSHVAISYAVFCLKKQ